MVAFRINLTPLFVGRDERGRAGGTFMGGVFESKYPRLVIVPMKATTPNLPSGFRMGCRELGNVGGVGNSWCVFDRTRGIV